jgi:hypothetical protein
MCPVSRVRSGDVEFERLEVVSEKSKVLFSHEGEKLLSLSLFFLPEPFGNEYLLVTNWLSGMGQEIIVLQYSDSKVRVANDLFSRGDKLEMMDIDGDTIPGIMVFERIDKPGASEAEKPLMINLFKWQGDSFRKVWHVKKETLMECLAKSGS